MLASRQPRHALLCALLLFACSRTPEPAAAPALPIPSAPAPATPARSDPTCTAPLDGPTARTQLRSARGQLTLGLLAGLKNASDENLASLQRMAAELQRRGAELLIADGDLGDNSAAQEALLGALASAQLPLVVAAGNRELRSDLDAAESALRKRGAQLIDLSQTRVVELGDLVLVGLPGAFDRRQLRADGACLYAQQDLDALAAWLDKQPQAAPPVLLVAAVPPRGDGPQALDFSEGQNVGDPRFIPLLTAQRAPFGVFGQVWEAGGRGVDGQGHPVAQKQLSNQLYVNPGAADRTPWPMDDGSSASGLAALMVVRGRQASYEQLRAPTAPTRSP